MNNAHRAAVHYTETKLNKIKKAYFGNFQMLRFQSNEVPLFKLF